MSYYKSGMVIKLTREACGMSQEELAENICSVQTLSRIENGRTGVKNETYRQLMERMERFSGRNYAICTGEDLKAMEYRECIEDAVRMHCYEEAEEYLEILKKEKISGTAHQQYLIRENAIVKRALGKMSDEESLREFKRALKLTVPNYEQYLDKVYPFTTEEILIIMNMGNYHLRKKEQKSAIEIYDMLLKDLSCNYMAEYDAQGLGIVISYNKMKCLGELDQFRESYQIGKKILELSIRINYAIIIPCIIGEMAWDIRCGIKHGELDCSYKWKYYHHLKAGYYIAAANDDKVMRDILKNELEKLI